MCFIAASYNYPQTMRSVWGRTEAEIGDLEWAYLCSPGERDVNDMGMGLYARVARSENLGLPASVFKERK